MAKSRTKEIAREKTPQERVKDSYSYEKACNAAKNSGTPTYHFAVGDRVQVGHLPNCVVEEVMDDDAVEPYKVVTLVMDYIDDKKMGEHLEVDCPSHLIRDADVLRRKGISVTRISAFAKPEDTQRFVCKHPNLIKQVEKGTNMFDVFVFPIDCITRIRAGEKVLWTNPTT